MSPFVPSPRALLLDVASCWVLPLVRQFTTCTSVGAVLAAELSSPTCRDVGDVGGATPIHPHQAPGPEQPSTQPQPRLTPVGAYLGGRLLARRHAAPSSGVATSLADSRALPDLNAFVAAIATSVQRRTLCTSRASCSGGGGGGGSSSGSGADSGGTDSGSGAGGGGGPGGGREAVISPALEARLKQLRAKCGELEARLSGPDARDVGREYSQLRPLAEAYDRLEAVRQELSGLSALRRDPDPALRALAAEEEAHLGEQATALCRRLLLALVPRDPRDSRPALLEVRAGAGGLEAALFAGELLAMYQRLAQAKGWTWEVMEQAANDLGGVRHALIAISDPGSRGAAGGADSTGDGSGMGTADDGGGGGTAGVYGTLATESGVHRVQRVPVTEAGGRVHTSTVAVVVLPQADEVDVRIREEDLRVETMRASGAGGQHVNVTDSAVRITHVPSGLVVSCQNERSQHSNRAAALKVLRARLYDMEQQKRARELESQRAAQVASADRSDRIRTYNFQQGRVTDHRIHLTLHDLADVLAGGEGLTELMQALARAGEEAALEALSRGG